MQTVSQAYCEYFVWIIYFPLQQHSDVLLSKLLRETQAENSVDIGEIFNMFA